MLLFTACTAGKTDTAGDGAVRKLIIDTDTGADDASALILAAKTAGIEILGVTTFVGNTDLAQDTISFIIDTVRENPGEIEIVILGPATNLALAIERDPDVMRQVKRIWSMGSAGLGPGNASPVAEFNDCGDAEAYRVVLESGIPMTIIGLDMCGGDAMWTGKQFDALEKTGEIGRFVTASFGKLREFYASNGSADAVMNCDGLAMTCVLRPDFVKSTIQVHGSCITEPGETYGQVIFYKEGFTYDFVPNDFDYSVTLVTEADGANYFNLYRDAVRR